MHAVRRLRVAAVPERVGRRARRRALRSSGAGKRPLLACLARLRSRCTPRMSRGPRDSAWQASGRLIRPAAAHPHSTRPGRSADGIHAAPRFSTLLRPAAAPPRRSGSHEQSGAAPCRHDTTAALPPRVRSERTVLCIPADQSSMPLHRSPECWRCRSCGIRGWPTGQVVRQCTSFAARTPRRALENHVIASSATDRRHASRRRRAHGTSDRRVRPRPPRRRAAAARPSRRGTHRTAPGSGTASR